MAAGTGAASGQAGRGSSAALQSTLDRRFQGVSNTMESIQGLSNWCIENKKHHSLIVRYWMKWLKKSPASHMLNLFYVANDVIQNCKRKNAIIYRTTFSEALPEAAVLVKDPKVRRSVERILTIWEERSVYPEELISEIRAGLTAPVNPKAALRSKILAEFVPQAFTEKLSEHRRSLEEAELKEKQLAALRVDVCSTEALKRLKDKAGGKKFSKDFEEGSTKLQDFVTFLEQQMKGGPPLLEALSNADIFYEMQYKEVKIIAKAYNTFANRVTHLKRKLDALKSTLPGLDDSPVPSPSEDAPSPTGSESPFHEMEAAPSAKLDKEALSDGDEVGIALADVPSPLSSPGASPLPAVPHGEKDNRDVEDMDLSEGEETGSPGIIVEEGGGKPTALPEPKPATVPAKPSPAQETNPPKQALPAVTPVTAVTATTAMTPTVSATPVTPATPLPVNLANVDLGKISSILSSLSSVMKSTGVSPVSRTSPGTPGTPTAPNSAQKPPAAAPGGSGPPPNPLASILSRVDISPVGLLSALSKTQSTGPQGASNEAGGPSGSSGAQQTAATAPSQSNVSGSPAASTAEPLATREDRRPPPPSALKKPLPGCGYTQEPVRRVGRELEKERESTPPVSSFPSTLESKIHKFLQGNPGFRGFDLGLSSGEGQGSSSNSPFLASENLDGTPVRDEAPGTPTQDEMMDEPRPEAFVANATTSSHNGGIRAGMSVDPAILARGNSLQSSAGLGSTEFESRDGHGLSPTAYRSESWGASDSTQIRFGEGVPNRQEYQQLGHPDLMSRPPHLANQDGYGAKPGNPPGRVEDFYDGRREGAGERRGMIAGEHYPLHPLSTGDCPRSAADAIVPDRSGGGGGGSEPNATKQEAPHYRQIERLVSPSSCGEGAPIESLGYNSRRPSGERIQTVESIRVIGRGGARPHPRGGESGARPNPGRGGGWYGDTDGAGAHPRNPGPFPHDDPHRQAFPFEERARLPYPGRDPQPQIPPSDFFNSPPPPIPPPPPPPIPQLPPPPKDFLAPPSSVMVGGVLVPVERPLSQPPPRGGEGEQRPGPVNTSAPVAPYKDHFPSRQAPSLSGSGPCRPLPSSLGRVREGPSPPPSSLSRPSPPLEHPRPQQNQHPSRSPPPQPFSLRGPPSLNLRPPHRPLLRPPQHQPRPHPPHQPRLHTPQRPPVRGQLPRPRPPRPALIDQEPPYRGVKRPGPQFSGPSRGGFSGNQFYPPKRPYFPPRY